MHATPHWPRTTATGRYSLIYSVDMEEKKQSCSSCGRTEEDHTLDIKMIKEKIILTDKLIKKYQQKCDDFDKQARKTAELATRLEENQRSTEIIRAQLEKSLKISEPLKKNVTRLHREKADAEWKLSDLKGKLKRSQAEYTKVLDELQAKETGECAWKLEQQVQAQELRHMQQSSKKLQKSHDRLQEILKKGKEQSKEKGRELASERRTAKKIEQQLQSAKEEIARLQQELKDAKANAKKPQPEAKTPPRKRKAKKRKSATAGSGPDRQTTSQILEEFREISQKLALSPIPPSPARTAGSGSSDDEDVESLSMPEDADDLFDFDFMEEATGMGATDDLAPGNATQETQPEEPKQGDTSENRHTALALSAPCTPEEGRGRGGTFASREANLGSRGPGATTHEELEERERLQGQDEGCAKTGIEPDLSFKCPNSPDDVLCDLTRENLNDGAKASVEEESCSIATEECEQELPFENVKKLEGKQSDSGEGSRIVEFRERETEKGTEANGTRVPVQTCLKEPAKQVCTELQMATEFSREDRLTLKGHDEEARGRKERMKSGDLPDTPIGFTRLKARRVKRRKGLTPPIRSSDCKEETGTETTGFSTQTSRECPEETADMEVSESRDHPVVDTNSENSSLHHAETDMSTVTLTNPAADDVVETGKTGSEGAQRRNDVGMETENVSDEGTFASLRKETAEVFLSEFQDCGLTPLSPLSDSLPASPPTEQISPSDAIRDILSVTEQLRPLSPIPPSPPKREDSYLTGVPPGKAAKRLRQQNENEPTAPAKKKTKMAKLECYSVGTLKIFVVAAKNAKKKKNQSGPFSVRPPQMSEVAYVVDCFRRLRDNEVQTHEAVEKFSNEGCLSSCVPLATGIVTALRRTNQDLSGGILRQYDMRTGSDAFQWKAMMTSLESRLVHVILCLSRTWVSRDFVSEVISLTSREAFRSWRSGTEPNCLGIASQCRFLTALCRTQDELPKMRVLCHDILRTFHPTPHVGLHALLAVCAVWPAVLRPDTPDQVFVLTLRFVTFKWIQEYPLAVSGHVKWLQNYPLAELSHVLFWLCGWQPLAPSSRSLDELAEGLVEMLRNADSGDVKLRPDGDLSLPGSLFEVVKCLELLCCVLGWQWTHDTFISQTLWSVLDTWAAETSRRNAPNDPSPVDDVQSAQDPGNPFVEDVQTVPNTDRDVQSARNPGDRIVEDAQSNPNPCDPSVEGTGKAQNSGDSPAENVQCARNSGDLFVEDSRSEQHSSATLLEDVRSAQNSGDSPAENVQCARNSGDLVFVEDSPSEQHSSATLLEDVRSAQNSGVPFVESIQTAQDSDDLSVADVQCVQNSCGPSLEDVQSAQISGDFSPEGDQSAKSSCEPLVEDARSVRDFDDRLMEDVQKAQDSGNPLAEDAQIKQTSANPSVENVESRQGAGDPCEDDVQSVHRSGGPSVEDGPSLQKSDRSPVEDVESAQSCCKPSVEDAQSVQNSGDAFLDDSGSAQNSGDLPQFRENGSNKADASDGVADRQTVPPADTSVDRQTAPSALTAAPVIGSSVGQTCREGIEVAAGSQNVEAAASQSAVHVDVKGNFASATGVTLYQAAGGGGGEGESPTESPTAGSGSESVVLREKVITRAGESEEELGLIQGEISEELIRRRVGPPARHDEAAINERGVALEKGKVGGSQMPKETVETLQCAATNDGTALLTPEGSGVGEECVSTAGEAKKPVGNLKQNKVPFRTVAGSRRHSVLGEKPADKEPSRAVDAGLVSESTVVALIRLLGSVCRNFIHKSPSEELVDTLEGLLRLAASGPQVTHQVQFAAALSLLDLSPWQPNRVVRVLDDWLTKQPISGGYPQTSSVISGRLDSLKQFIAARCKGISPQCLSS